jgi:uncharacterized protein YegP (UPF0339 family)
MKEFIQNCKGWAFANKPLAIVIVAAVAIVLISIIALIAKSAKSKKTKKQTKTTVAVADATAVKATAPTPTPTQPIEDKAAEEKAARLAVLERLEQERLATEREEEERIAAEKAEQERIANEKAAAEKAEQERIANEKAAAEKAEQERIANEKAAIKKAVKPKTATAKTTVKAEPKKEEKPATRITGTSTAAPAPKPATKTPSKKYSGKWTIFKMTTDNPDDEETFFFELRASNGEKLLSSEEYTSYNGVLKGIETHKANIEKGNFRITLSKKGDYIFKLLSGKNMLLCMGEKYPTRARCESAIESTKRFAATAVIDEKVQEQMVKVPVDDEALEELADGYNGKWIINSAENEGDKVFYFELYANNGEKLLSSEEYTTYIGAVNGIQTHKTNIEKGNFRISLTKRGDYIYKLLNGNGQLLCLGEHYKTKSRCQSAVESVKRFAKNSPVLTDPEHTK